MQEIKDLRYTPPVRGKIGTLYSGRLLWTDLIFILCLFIMPNYLMRKARGVIEKMLEKAIIEQNGIMGKRIKFVDSGTSALLIALKMARAANAPVYLNANTCQSACAAVVRAGGIPVFLGTTTEGLTDLDYIPGPTAGSPRGILLITNTYGFLENTQKANDVAKKMNLFVINDLAQANILSKKFAEACGNADISVLSFGPEKYIAALGGGAVVVNEPDLQKLEEVASGASCYESGDRTNAMKTLLQRLKYYLTFYAVDGPAYRFLLKRDIVFEIAPYKDIDNISIPSSINARPSNPALAMGVLLRIMSLRRRAKREGEIYSELIRALPSDMLASADRSGYVPPFLVVKTPLGERNRVAAELAEAGFQSTWNYVPLYMLKPFRNYRHTGDSRVWTTFLQVPFRHLPEKEVRAVSEILCHAYRKR